MIGRTGDPRAAHDKTRLPGGPDPQRISVVIIGLDVQRCLGECIASVLAADYPQECLEIVYVDGGSMDRSVEIAKSYGRVQIIELQDPHPTPGKGRNAGMAAAGFPVIQFLDADTLLEPGWFRAALPHLRGNTAAVAGRVRERYPGKNVYHLIGNMEWGISAGRNGHLFTEGPAGVFGGMVLVRKDAIEQSGGYDGSLVAGEDPDLSYRLRRQGWVIYRTTADMAVHDLNMTTFRQYARRAFRSGHAYAQVGLRYGRERERFFLRPLLRICMSALAPAAVLTLGAALKRYRAAAVVAGLLAGRPFLRIYRFMDSPRDLPAAALYCAHLAFAVYPQFLGVLRYLLTTVTGAPLQNRGYQAGGNADKGGPRSGSF